MTPRDPDWRAAALAGFERQGLLRSFGAEVLDMGPGRVVIAAPITEATSQQHGYGHAGLSFALGDSAGGFAAQTLLEPGKGVLTIEMKINLLSPAQGERLIANGQVEKPGRRISVVRADVENEAGRAVATLLGTMMIVDG